MATSLKEKTTKKKSKIFQPRPLSDPIFFFEALLKLRLLKFHVCGG